MLVDVAISGDRNVIKKEAGKLLYYKKITIEIQRTWTVKTKVIALILAATEAISKAFRYLNNFKPFGKARHQGATEESHTELCACTLESTNVKVQNISTVEFLLKTWFVPGV